MKTRNENLSGRILGGRWVCSMMVFIIMAAFSLSSCSPRNKSDEPLPLPVSEFKLRSGDTINIRFLYWPELNDTQVIRPDGQIALQMVGDIHAADLTPNELDESLTHAYARYLRNPEIVVVTRAMPSQRVFIGGEVLDPGAVPLVQGLTVMQAVMLAGGFDKTSAQLKNVIVIRHVEGKRYATSVDLRKGFEEEMSDPVYLAVNDVVYVPRTYIDELNQWVEQHVDGLLAGMQITPTPVSGRIGYSTFSGR